MHQQKIGSLLVDRGLLTNDQVERILERQQDERRPFGALAQEMFGVPEHEIWRVWAQQLAQFCKSVDLPAETCEPDVCKLVTAQQAWTNHVIPLRNDDGELVCATTREDLPNAMGLMHNVFDGPITFVLAEARQIEQFIMQHYDAKVASHLKHA